MPSYKTITTSFPCHLNNKTYGEKPTTMECTEKRQATSTNKGGKTDYYALPPESEEPTLNDLIEYKDMPFWRGEAFKALYALEERANRAKDGSASEERELNKVIYYCNRRLNMLKNGIDT